MKYNKLKNELIDEINRLLGLMITLRTVETSPLDSSHWVNYHIDTLSTLRNDLQDEKFDCEFCDGSGAVYDGFAQVLSDAQCCPQCQGVGFNSQKIKSEVEAILETSKSKKSSSLINYCEEVLERLIN